MKQEHRLQTDQRVKLKGNGEDQPYSFAAAGSEGWVRKLEHDGVGFPVVYIEWDKDHWAYNGEPNQWTLEAHFEPVEEAEMAKKDKQPKSEKQLFAEFLEWRERENKSEKDKTPAIGAEYEAVLERAAQVGKTADAFLMIAVQTLPGDEDSPAYNPIVVNYYKDEAAGLLLESQLARLVAEGYAHLTMVEVRKLLSSRSEA